jgi:1-acyl-sn-glycerol-3-phosphate acyltransferase
LEYEDYKELKTTEIAALVEKQIRETIDANVEE